MDVSLEGLIGAAEVGTASRVDAFGNLASIEEPMSCSALSMRSDMFVQRRAEAGKYVYPLRNCGWHRWPKPGGHVMVEWGYPFLR
jgi:hypothetical protein